MNVLNMSHGGISPQAMGGVRIEMSHKEYLDLVLLLSATSSRTSLSSNDVERSKRLYAAIRNEEAEHDD